MSNLISLRPTWQQKLKRFLKNVQPVAKTMRQHVKFNK